MSNSTTEYLKREGELATQRIENARKYAAHKPDAIECMQDGPRKEASPRCESGGRDYCTCDICF